MGVDGVDAQDKDQRRKDVFQQRQEAKEAESHVHGATLSGSGAGALGAGSTRF